MEMEFNHWLWQSAKFYSSLKHITLQVPAAVGCYVLLYCILYMHAMYSVNMQLRYCLLRRADLSAGVAAMAVFSACFIAGSA